MERVKGEQQELHQALGRLVRLRAYKSGTTDRPVEQFSITIPRAIARVMQNRTSTWAWDMTDDGVLLRPIDEPDKLEALPAWAQNGNAA